MGIGGGRDGETSVYMIREERRGRRGDLCVNEYGGEERRGEEGRPRQMVTKILERCVMVGPRKAGPI